MSRTASRKAYLVSQSGSIGAPGPVYATVGEDPTDAVEAVAKATGAATSELSFAGSLSRGVVRGLGLKPGEVRRI